MMAPLASLWGLFGDNSEHWLNVGLVSLVTFTAASYGFLFFVDTPYQRAVGISGMRHMAAFIEFYFKRPNAHYKKDRLKENARELIQLKFVENLSYKEIAERTGLSVGNVGYKLHHAIKFLAKELKKEGIMG